MQFGTNHLGHFALTGLLLDNMLSVDGSRVVTVSSVGHRILARIHFDDPHLAASTTASRHTASPSWPTCCSPTSWQRRLKAKGAPTIGVRRAPRRVDTELLRNLPGFIRGPAFIWRLDPRADKGALPTLRAATDPMRKAASTTARRDRRSARSPESR